MNRYVLLKVVLTLLLAIILGFSVNSFLQKYDAEAIAIVATRQIQEGEIITEQMLREERVRLKEKEQLAPNSSSSKEDFIGEVARTTIPAGRPLDIFYDIIDSSGGFNPAVGGFSESHALKHEDHRILTLNLSSEDTFQGRLLKDDLVDILATTQDSQGETEVVVLAQGIRVHRTSSEGGLVSFIVTPDEAMRIALLSETGSLNFLLASHKSRTIPANRRRKDINLTMSEIISY